jgi:tRNA (guanine-N7-)-methyltransferase
MTPPDFQAVLAQRRAGLVSFLENALRSARSFVWEVGCGHGHFLTAYAQAHPDEVCIGVDIAGDRIARALRKRDRAKLPRLHFVQGDARLFLEAIPGPVAISSVYILFPDPWPKLRHHKHRILQPRFLHQLRERVGDNARLYFRTDYAPYFEDARITLQEAPDWQITGGPWPFEHETVFQQRAESHFSLIAKPTPPPAHSPVVGDSDSADRRSFAR